jgi:hypothetical protein
LKQKVLTVTPSTSRSAVAADAELLLKLREKYGTTDEAPHNAADGSDAQSTQRAIGDKGPRQVKPTEGYDDGFFKR